MDGESSTSFNIKDKISLDELNKQNSSKSLAMKVEQENKIKELPSVVQIYLPSHILNSNPMTNNPSKTLIGIKTQTSGIYHHQKAIVKGTTIGPLNEETNNEKSQLDSGTELPIDLHLSDPMLEIEIDDSCSSSSNVKEANSNKSTTKKSVLFDTVTVYHFTRSQGFSSIPSQGGSTLGMKRRHFFRRKLSVDLFEEVRRRSRREILLKIKFDKERVKDTSDQTNDQMLCNSVSSTTSSSSSSTSTNATTSDSNDDSYSDNSDISDSELESESYVFLQPIGVKLRRSLLRASGIGRIDPKERVDCKVIRESRERSGCKCVDQCIPGLCECSRLGVNCHVDRVSFPCGCISAGCQNPLGRTEFDIRSVKRHLFETLFKVDGVG